MCQHEVEGREDIGYGDDERSVLGAGDGLGLAVCFCESRCGHTVNLIKRDSKRPGGDIAKTAVQELETREDVDILAGFVYAPNAIASAQLATRAPVPMIVMNAGTAWIPSLSPYIVRVSFTMW